MPMGTLIDGSSDVSSGSWTREGPKITYRGVIYASATTTTCVEAGTLSPHYIYGHEVPFYTLNGNRLLLKNPKHQRHLQWRR
jgi:hypothetical protein